MPQQPNANLNAIDEEDSESYERTYANPKGHVVSEAEESDYEMEISQKEASIHLSVEEERPR